MLVPTTAETLYCYGDEFYKQYAAITKNSCGKGYVYYLGTTPDADTLTGVINDIITDAKIEKTHSPNGVEIVNRGTTDSQIKMVINHNDFETVFNDITLKPFEVRIIHQG